MTSDSENKVQQTISDQLGNVSTALDDGLSAASAALRSGAASARDGADQASSTAQEWYAAAAAHLKQADDKLMSTLKQGVELAVEHETAAIAAGVAFAAVLIPGPRRFLWRHTLGRLQSTEAAHKSAELKVAALAERVDSQGGEVEKLAERLALAQDEYARGLAKLKATASELRSLASRVQGTERSAQSLMYNLRELRSKQALQLRSDVAVKAAAAAKQRAGLEKLVMGLEKKGL